MNLAYDRVQSQALNDDSLNILNATVCSTTYRRVPTSDGSRRARFRLDGLPYKHAFSIVKKSVHDQILRVTVNTVTQSERHPP